MESLIILMVLAALGLPVVAIVLALTQFSKNRLMQTRADAQARVLADAQRELRTLESRVRRLEQQPQDRREPEPPVPPVEAPAVEKPEMPEQPAPVHVRAPMQPPRPAAPPSPPVKATPPPAPPPKRPTITASSAAPEVKTSTPPLATATAGEGIERQFGTRIVVWLGAIALALAGAFLVKYSFERGLIGPAPRVALGLAFGASLIGVGEWMRRRYAGLAQGLAAAGVAVLYAALLAGVKLYALFPPSVGFLGMLVTTAAAVVLSMRHGQLVAVLGLLGGFLTPILVGSGEPRPWLLLVYLALLQSGLLVVSRRMKWWPVAGLTLLGAMGWAVLWLADMAAVGGGTLHVGLLLMGSMVSVVVAAGRASGAETWGDDTVPQALVWGGVGLGTLLLAVLVGVGDFGLIEWTFLGIVGAGCIVLGRLEPRYEGLAWIASLAGALLLFSWGLTPLIDQPLAVWITAVAFVALYVGGAWCALWGSEAPQRWAALASVSAIIYLLAAYGALAETAFRVPWGVQATVLALVLAGLAVPVARRREALAQGAETLAALAVGVTALVSLAIPMELERAWIAVAWALEIPALAWIAIRLRVPQLEKLAWVLGGVAAVRLLANPGVFDYPIGDGLFFNWLLYGYGISIAAFVVGALLFRRAKQEQLADGLEIGAMLLGFAYITLSVRQFFHPGDLASSDFEFAELGAFVVLWLLYGIGLLALHGLTSRRIHGFAGVASGLLAVGFGVLIPGLALNPLWHRYEVGPTPIFNLLLFVFGLPAVLAVVFGRALYNRDLRMPAWLSGSAALLFGFLTLTLEVRQAFHGTLLQGTTTNAEMYTYSLVWILFGVALLVAGIMRGGIVLRYGSAVVMTVAVGKVFLIDTAELQDLYRVLSLFGLGVTLMVLAFLYQRFVFRDRATGVRP